MSGIFGRGAQKLFSAAAKPLKTRLCLEQARDFSIATAGIQLSEKTMDAFRGYLTHEHTSAETRILVLAELSERAKIEQNAFVLVDFLTVEEALLDELFQSPVVKVKAYTCVLIGNLASHKSTRDTTVLFEPCSRIVRLLRDPDYYVRDAALFALIKISISPDGVQAIIKAQTLEFAANLLSSRMTEERVKTSKLITKIAEQQSNVSAICSLNLPMRFVFLTSDSDAGVCRSATTALSVICRSPEGARAMVESKILPCIEKLLQSPDALTRASVCQVVGRLAMDKETLAAVLEIHPSQRLVDLVNDPDEEVRRSSAFALSKVALTLDGARAVAVAHAPERVVAHLSSPNLELRKWTCHIMLHLAKHPTALPAVLASNPCTQLLVLVSGTNFELRQHALAALAEISRWPDGAAAVVQAQVTAKAARLLYDPHPKIRAETSRILGNLALHETTLASVVSIEPYARLVSFLSDPDNDLRRCALYALAKISMRTEGAQAIVEANALHDATTHLSSPVIEIRKFACELLGHVAQHEETLPWVISLDPCAQLVSMLSDANIEVSKSAAAALAKISIWPDGAAAVGAAKAVNGAMPLLESPDTQMQQWIATMLANLVQHQQATFTYATTGVGELVATLNIGSSGRVMAENIRLRTPSDSAQGPQVPEALQEIGHLLGSTPDRKLASNMLEGLALFMLTGLKDKDLGRYLVVFRVLMIGTAYESLRKQGELLGAPPGQDPENVNVRPINILEGLANVITSEAESDVGFGFCACWILIQLVRYKSGMNPSH
ncbi:armadillo-type protein [Mycena galericulata]|nr:armadillo-type protein [Mycena galericulata]